MREKNMLKLKMEREVEKKYDVPLEFDDEGFLYALRDCVVAAGYEIDKPEVLSRRFTYYDTPSLSLYHADGTLRRVEGFDPARHKGKFRYDLKVGPLHDRIEGNYWTNELQDVNSLFREERQGLGISGDVEEVAVATMLNYQGDIRKGSLVAEYTLDYVAVLGAGSFKELELELKEGNERDLQDLGGIVQAHFDLNELTEQKYSRILRVLGKA
ncbi:MAG: hypothetical protein Q8Q31_04075 [Nanoarchaeota archaeon]|nr:hypothetical protein [Nanoarchaeota archaeon]